MLRPALRCRPAAAQLAATSAVTGWRGGGSSSSSNSGTCRRRAAADAGARCCATGGVPIHRLGGTAEPQRSPFLGRRWFPKAPTALPQSRAFATASLSVKGDASEQVLLIVGLNEDKFFGPDGAEEALKLLERVADHDPHYHVLLGLPAKELATIEKENPVKDRKLSPKSKIEKERFCEFIPVVQAAMLDRRPRQALDRELRVTQCHVAWHLWKTPREAIKVYWAWWSRNQYKNAECFRFWSHHFPISSHGHFNERAELISLRTIEHLILERQKRSSSTTVLVVRNDLFSLVNERLSVTLDESAVRKMESIEFSRDLQNRAAELDQKVPDLTSLLVFVYFGIPFFICQHVVLASEYFFKDAITEKLEIVHEESRE